MFRHGARLINGCDLAFTKVAYIALCHRCQQSATVTVVSHVNHTSGSDHIITSRKISNAHNRFSAISNHTSSQAQIDAAACTASSKLCHKRDNFNYGGGNERSVWKYLLGSGLLVGLIKVLIDEISDNSQEESTHRTLFQKIMPTAYCATPVGPGGDTRNLRSQYNFIADVVEKVSPAVVHIKARCVYIRHL